jgi:hypothetical protein
MLHEHTDLQYPTVKYKRCICLSVHSVIMQDIHYQAQTPRESIAQMQTINRSLSKFYHIATRV